MTDIFSVATDARSGHREVYRLSTSAWHVNGKFCVQKNLSLLKRQSKIDHAALQEDCDQCGALEVSRWIKNLYTVPDGIYVLKIVDLWRDYESGEISEYNYELFPYEKKRISRPPDVLKALAELATEKPTKQDLDQSFQPEPCGDCDPCVVGRPDQCAISPQGWKCETCQSIATVHVEALGMHFCKSCIAKIDQRIQKKIKS